MTIKAINFKKMTVVIVFLEKERYNEKEDVYIII